MGTRVEEFVFDDIAKSEGQDVPANNKISFSLDGKNYLIDLCDANAEKLRDALAPFVAVAEEQPQRGGRKSGSGKKGSSSSSKKSTDGQRSPEENDAIRKWANENGLAVSERGRIKQDVLDAYYAAQTGQQPGQVSDDQIVHQPQPAAVG